jgi:hypothetical protein
MRIDHPDFMYRPSGIPLYATPRPTLGGAVGQNPAQSRLGALHAAAVDGEGGVQEDLEQQAIEQRQDQPGRVLAFLVVTLSQQGRDAGARATEARGDHVSDGGIVLCLCERADEVPGQWSLALPGVLHYLAGTLESGYALDLDRPGGSRLHAPNPE